MNTIVHLYFFLSKYCFIQLMVYASGCIVEEIKYTILIRILIIHNKIRQSLCKAIIMLTKFNVSLISLIFINEMCYCDPLFHLLKWTISTAEFIVCLTSNFALIFYRWSNNFVTRFELCHNHSISEKSFGFPFFHKDKLPRNSNLTQNQKWIFS